MDLKKRIDLLDDRVKKLMEKYPVVTVAVFGSGMVVGLLLGWWWF